MVPKTRTEELDQLRRERDLYLRLLGLGSQTELEPFLKEALSLVVDVIGARRGYIELRDERDGREVLWSIAHSFSPDEVEQVRQTVSSGIVAEALSTGRVVETPSALLDPRFSDRASVRVGRIEMVICAPIGASPPLGVLYLEGRRSAEPLGEDARERVELVAMHLAPIADHLLVRQRVGDGEDATRALRDKLRIDEVIGRSRALASLLAEVALVAPLDVSVLLSGASGTGKSQIARVIHDNGPRAAGPFIELNCAAIPETLVESELFGAMPGSHSTATSRIEGKVSAAQHGTLFLDEIGDIALPVQAKLLQLLQSKQYYPLGATEAHSADVRVVAATNSDLETAVAERRFREDLYYRLNVLPLRVPSLSERGGDALDLARHFCDRACERNGFARLELSVGALRAIEAAEWPGNVRQLQHAVEAACIRAAGEGASQLARNHLFPSSSGGQAGAAEAEASEQTFQEATREFQREFLVRVLEEEQWNVSAAARRLDVVRSHVYNLINAFGIERDD